MHLCRQGHMTSCLPREPGEPLCFICVDFKRNRSSGYEGASQRAGGGDLKDVIRQPTERIASFDVGCELTQHWFWNRGAVGWIFLFTYLRIYSCSRKWFFFFIVFFPRCFTQCCRKKTKTEPASETRLPSTECIWASASVGLRATVTCSEWRWRITAGRSLCI